MTQLKKITPPLRWLQACSVPSLCPKTEPSLLHWGHFKCCLLPTDFSFQENRGSKGKAHSSLAFFSTCKHVCVLAYFPSLSRKGLKRCSFSWIKPVPVNVLYVSLVPFVLCKDLPASVRTTTDLLLLYLQHLPGQQVSPHGFRKGT